MKIIEFIMDNRNSYAEIWCPHSYSETQEDIVSNYCPNDFGFKNKFNCESVSAIGLQCDECWNQDTK